tara:strand:- start:1965 stop:3869 length:1905 start_codon:yes stop_codon:yes gene_type:complete
MAQWIAAVARGHNSGVALLKDGKLVFALEEERLTRAKYDGGPLASILKIKEYTDRLDYFVCVHTTRLDGHPDMKLDYSMNDPYYGLARKIGLLPDVNSLPEDEIKKRTCGAEVPKNVIDMGHIHHRTHAAAAFYNSGFENAVAVIVDGAGSWVKFGAKKKEVEDYWETETIFECAYPHKFDTKYKHLGSKFASPLNYYNNFDSGFWSGYGQDVNYESPQNDHHELIASHKCGIVKTYEAVTEYCGFPAIEAGKTMGLSPYGKECSYIPPLFNKCGMLPVDLADSNIFTPMYPNGAIQNLWYEPEINEIVSEKEYETGVADSKIKQSYDCEGRKNFAWRVQNDTQQQVLNLIRKAVKDSGIKNVVLSGGYGLNCVANYWYLDQLKDEGINLYVEPVSNDAGTALGAALLWHHRITKDTRVRDRIENLYLGPQYNYMEETINKMVYDYEAEIKDATYADVVELITNKNIVALFQGRSEAGPRALGNRSLLYDPRDPDGKDHVNKLKRREFFRPFAGSILKEHVHEWFDLRGMEDTPFMMYAVNCQPGIEEKIPAIIHVDKTCRIQTVTKQQNNHYYNIINEFYQQTGCPIIFNTSFNLGGEPLVETLEDAMKTLSNSGLEYLYLPEYNKLIKVPND